MFFRPNDQPISAHCNRIIALVTPSIHHHSTGEWRDWPYSHLFPNSQSFIWHTEFLWSVVFSLGPRRVLSHEPSDRRQPHLSFSIELLWLWLELWFLVGLRANVNICGGFKLPVYILVSGELLVNPYLGRDHFKFLQWAESAALSVPSRFGML